MLNAEKFKKEILNIVNDDFDLAVNKNDPNGVSKCGSFPCADCMFSKEENGKSRCTRNRINWLLSEYKNPVKLTRLEHELLKFINNEGYKYIARDKCGETLFRYPEKPTKNIYDEWGKGGICSDLRMFNDLFKFVKWEDEEPTLVADILKNCEVIENESK